jgi:cell wall-associated NlpC family hydrolase
LRFRWLMLLGVVSILTPVRPAYADDTLTLELPPSEAAVAQRAAERARQKAATIEAARQLTMTRQQTRSNSFSSGGFRMPSRGGKADRVVGRLGELTNFTSIYRTQSTRAAKLTTAPAGTYVAIEEDAGEWYGVLMADSSVGWLPRSAVTLLDSQAVMSGSNAMPSFGGGSDSYSRTAGAYFQGDSARLIREAYRYLGVPYHWGGNTASGLDCSAFMKNVFGTCGCALPRTAAEQVGMGLPVTPDQLQPGDRIYFGHASISHTGLYIGNGYFIHASSAHHRVVISQLSESLYTRLYACARR